MAARDRKNPKPSKASESDYTLRQFLKDFPDDDACLEWLWRNRFSEDGKHAECPKCEQVRVFKRYATKQRRQSWTCTGCGHHIQVTAGTIFHGSSTPLDSWFYAMYLMTSTRCGLSAKQLEREIGVGYKTAWRMLNLIRNELMGEDGGEPLSGDVEMDETLIGGKPRKGDVRTRQQAGRWKETKAQVFAMVERDGRAKAVVIPDSQGKTLRSAIEGEVDAGAVIHTDEWPTYKTIGKQFAGHTRVNHSAREYARGNAYTNTVEGYFSNLKNALIGTHHGVSKKWLQSYVDEFTWRYNCRKDREPAFLTLLGRSLR